MTWSQKRFVLCYLFVTIIIIYFHNSYHTFCSSFLVICAWEASLTRIWCNEHWNVLHPSPWSGTLCLKCRFWALKCPRTPPRCNPLVLSQSACVCAPACLRVFFVRRVFALSLGSEMHAPLSSDSPEWHSHGRVPARQLPMCPLTD